MKLQFSFTVISLVFSLFAHASDVEKKTYGQDFDGKAAQSLDAVVDAAKTKTLLGQDTVVQAKVDKVCQSSGCWFEAKTSAGEAIRVTFKDYAFFIPKDSMGKAVTMKGRFTEKTLSVKTQRHYLKDAKAPQKEIDSVVAPKVVLQFEASGLKI